MVFGQIGGNLSTAAFLRAGPYGLNRRKFIAHDTHPRRYLTRE